MGITIGNLDTQVLTANFIIILLVHVILLKGLINVKFRFASFIRITKFKPSAYLYYITCRLLKV